MAAMSMDTGHQALSTLRSWPQISKVLKDTEYCRYPILPMMSLMFQGLGEQMPGAGRVLCLMAAQVCSPKSLLKTMLPALASQRQ
jgi:hypothetical protein